MASRHFDPTDFASVAALTVEQLLTAIVESDTAFTLGRLCEKLESLRAEQVKALAIQNMYRSEEWRNRLWYVAPHEEHAGREQQATALRARNQQLKFCQDGIGLSATWEKRLKSIGDRVDVLYEDWATLCEHTKTYGGLNADLCRNTAQRIIGEQRWLRDQDGFVSVSMTVLANHRGVKDLNFISDGAGDLSSKGMAAKFTWVSFR